MRRIVVQTRLLGFRVPTRRCDEPGCTEPTREHKPYCTTHVLNVDRAKTLRGILDDAEREIERVGLKGPKAVNMDGLVIEEILTGISHQGQVTWRRLCNNISFLHDVKKKTSDYYLNRLKKEGLVAVFVNARFNAVVSLTPKGFHLVRGGNK